MDSFSGGCGSRLAFLGLHWKRALLSTRVDPLAPYPVRGKRELHLAGWKRCLVDVSFGAVERSNV